MREKTRNEIDRSRRSASSRRSVYLLCLIFSGGGLGVAVGDGDWNCQETRLLCDIPLSDIQWRSRSCSATISLSSCTRPGGSREYLAANRATSSRHKTTFRGWACSTVRRNDRFIVHAIKMTKSRVTSLTLMFCYSMRIRVLTAFSSHLAFFRRLLTVTRKRMLKAARPRHAWSRWLRHCVIARALCPGSD